MENKEQDRALQTPAEPNQDEQINYFAEDPETAGNEDNVESRRYRHDADSGNDGSSNKILQREKRIDPGNEHHHRTDADDKIFDDDIDRMSKYDADAGGDGTGSTGPDPGEE